MSQYKWTEDGRFPFFILFLGLSIPMGLIVTEMISLNPYYPSFFSSSSSSSSGSSKTLENGDIPGYSACVERMMRTNPSAKQRVCCDKLGGSWSQKGSFGTCRK